MTATIVFALMVVAGVTLSALCAGIETGVYTFNRVRLALRAARGERRALVVRDEIDHPNRLLAALLIANTVGSDIVAIGMSHLFDKAGFGPIMAVVVNTIVVVPLLFVFGDVLPKDLFRRVADRALLALAPVIRAGRLILTWCGLVPLVQGVSTLVLRRIGASTVAPVSSRQRVARLFEEGAGAGVLSEEQVSLAERVMGVAGRTVAERMVPWRRAATIRSDMDHAARVAAMRRASYSRYPVTAPDGRVVGIVTALELLVQPDRRVGELMQEPLRLAPTTTLLESLDALRRARAKIAIVGDANQTPLGVISLNDLLEPLVGSFTGDL